MPRGDRTGPLGMGRLTGRKAGFCNGYVKPGYLNVSVGNNGTSRRGCRSIIFIFVGIISGFIYLSNKMKYFGRNSRNKV